MPEIIDFDARPTAIDGLLFLTMKQVSDERGTVREFFRESAIVRRRPAGARPLATGERHRTRGGVPCAGCTPRRS